MPTYTFSGRCYSKSGDVEKYESIHGGALSWKAEVDAATASDTGVTLEENYQNPSTDNNGNYYYVLSYDPGKVDDGAKVTVTGQSNYAGVCKYLNFSFYGQQVSDADYAIYIVGYFPGQYQGPINVGGTLTAHGSKSDVEYDLTAKLAPSIQNADNYAWMAASGSTDWDVKIDKNATQAFDLSIGFSPQDDTMYEIDNVSLGTWDITNDPPFSAKYDLITPNQYQLSTSATAANTWRVGIDLVSKSLPYSLLSQKVASQGAIGICFTFIEMNNPYVKFTIQTSSIAGSPRNSGTYPYGKVYINTYDWGNQSLSNKLLPYSGTITEKIDADEGSGWEISYGVEISLGSIYPTDCKVGNYWQCSIQISGFTVSGNLPDTLDIQCDNGSGDYVTSGHCSFTKSAGDGNGFILHIEFSEADIANMANNNPNASSFVGSLYMESPNAITGTATSSYGDTGTVNVDITLIE